jgi:hypothetical protein
MSTPPRPAPEHALLASVFGQRQEHMHDGITPFIKTLMFVSVLENQSVLFIRRTMEGDDPDAVPRKRLSGLM